MKLLHCVKGSVLQTSRLTVQTLREIFDEAAYARFLSRTGRQPSKTAYLEFLREQEGTKIRQPRCC